jgi:hypothetical protein
LSIDDVIYQDFVLVRSLALKRRSRCSFPPHYLETSARIAVCFRHTFYHICDPQDAYASISQTQGPIKAAGSSNYE